MEREVLAQKVKGLLPSEKVEEFFEAFYFGEEPAYHLELDLRDWDLEKGVLTLELRLIARPGKCLACNLTSGLPDVFRRHPILNLAGVAENAVRLLGDGYALQAWELGWTEQVNADLHVVPFIIRVKKKE